MSEGERREPNLLHPGHLFTWLALIALRPLVKLPWNVQISLGRAFGWFFFHVIRYRRKIIEINIRLCFPEKSPAERHQLALAHCEAMGIGIFETMMAWWAPDEDLPPYEIEGREHLEQAIASEKGALLLNAHFTTLEICGRFLCDNFRIGCLFRDPDNPVIAREMHRQRFAKMTIAIPINDLRGLIRALRDGHIIWYAPDQSRRGKFSAVLPFFGIPAQTNTATSRLSEMTGAAVIPFFAFRKEDGSYILRILPPLDHFPTADHNADALRINHLIEENIQEAPEQYFWIHRRFKRLGRGFKRVYPRRKKKKKGEPSSPD